MKSPAVNSNLGAQMESHYAWARSFLSSMPILSSRRIASETRRGRCSSRQTLLSSSTNLVSLFGSGAFINQVQRGIHLTWFFSFSQDVMQVANHYFENGITHFTRRINKCISLGCANGEVAPFVGHNAFLRWSAVQDAAFVDPADGKTRQWSEANVSEDFDLALRLLLKGYNLRWATYSNGGFKEGVSLTVVDELARWQKYAYGSFISLFFFFLS